MLKHVLYFGMYSFCDMDLKAFTISYGTEILSLVLNSAKEMNFQFDFKNLFVLRMKMNYK